MLPSNGLSCISRMQPTHALSYARCVLIKCGSSSQVFFTLTLERKSISIINWSTGVTYSRNWRTFRKIMHISGTITKAPYDRLSSQSPKTTKYTYWAVDCNSHAEQSVKDWICMAVTWKHTRNIKGNMIWWCCLCSTSTCRHRGY